MEVVNYGLGGMHIYNTTVYPLAVVDMHVL